MIAKELLNVYPVMVGCLAIDVTVTSWLKEGRKHWALRPQKPLRLIGDGEVGGSGIFISNTYSLHCHHQNDSALTWAAV